MAENFQGDAAVVTERMCAICLEDSKNPPSLPCGHTFCDGCLDGWRSRYGVEEEMRTKCPICRARIPPSKEMVATLLMLRFRKQRLEDSNDTSSERYRDTCHLLAQAEKEVGADWDGVTILQYNNEEEAVVMPDYIHKAIRRGDIKAVLRWINANRTEDRANATSSAETARIPVLSVATTCNQLALMTQLLQLGANVDGRASSGTTAISFMVDSDLAVEGETMIRLLLSWGASFFPRHCFSRGECVSAARMYGKHRLANLLGSKLGGRRCEIVNLTSRPELNGKTCVADEYLRDSNQYKVTLEAKTKDVLILDPNNLKRRDRTPRDCGYYIEFKNGRMIRHDFDSSEDCQAFVAALNRDEEAQPTATKEAKAAAELLSALGIDDAPNESPISRCKTKKSKKKGGKKKKRNGGIRNPLDPVATAQTSNIGEQAESPLPPEAAAILPLEATAVSAGRKRRRRPLSKTSPLVRGGAGQTSASRPLAESRENSRGALRPARSACFSSPDVRPDSPRVRTMLLAPQKVF
ncbi:hypothetical protein THAOC_22548 [Thalassiosira oceanica]|uniref:RING-type domain-containing protein n=1 Tax=Thalassiosira oceanica TaxID=159749 RepID=K0RY48_THAOC|nr:hypothetical protein THAOC_22548 [Thalassiosira oceanica]|eukprot:EJK57409.1 hypothetical protein THAOC_22548 [Thalassiosira oceanica]